MATFQLAPGTIDTGLGDRKIKNIQRLLIDKFLSIYDYGTLTRGYALAGYKGTNCCNDVNRAQFASDSVIHIFSGVTNSNYSGGCSSYVYHKGIAWGWGTGCCQGSCNETKLWDMVTETESAGPTMACARTYPATFERHDKPDADQTASGRHDTISAYEAGYVSGGQGGCTQTNKYPFNTGTMTTVGASPNSAPGQTAWSQSRYSYAFANGGSGDGNPVAFHHSNETWTSATFSPGISTITTLAVTCDTHGFEKCYGGTHNPSPGFWKARGQDTTITSYTIGSWGGFRGVSTNYQSEWSPVHSNHASYFLGGHDSPGGQNTYSGKFDALTDNFSNMPAMDTYSDMSGTCSAAGFQQ